MMIIEQMLKNAQTPLLHIADVSGSALFQGDCLDIMPLIPDKSVQLILADLPYGTTACKWDSIIPFGFTLETIQTNYKTDNGAIVLTASQPFTTKLISSNYEMFHHELIWNKRFAANYAQAKTHPQKIHESVLVFGIKPKYYPQMILRDKPIKKGKNSGAEMYGGISGLGRADYVGKVYTHKYPETIIEYSSRAEKRGLHPTQKPLELMKYLIKTYSNENDMVLDNTMGSGTCPLAAKELNRKFIGIEREANYYEIACRRCGF
jgi:site-specific DNA-methyltransferase (adenine-specific)